MGEFPEATCSRAVLEAVGGGERTFTAIATQAGGEGPLPSGTLSPLLSTLQAKRVLAADLPLSTKPDNKNRRCRIADPYLHLVGADRDPVAGAVHFVGSIKWLGTQPFGRRDYDALVRALPAVPGTSTHTPLVAVSRSGVVDGLPLAARWGPEELVNAWRPR